MNNQETTKLKTLLAKAYDLLTLTTTDPETAIELAAKYVHQAQALVNGPQVVKYKDEAAVINAFWEEYTELAAERRPGRRHSDYSCDVQNAFDDFVDELTRAEEISEAMAGVLTLG